MNILIGKKYLKEATPDVLMALHNLSESLDGVEPSDIVEIVTAYLDERNKETIELSPLTPDRVKRAILAAQEQVMKIKAKHSPMSRHHWHGVFRQLYYKWVFHYKGYENRVRATEAVEAFHDWCVAQEG